ncbi:hypothetical protein ACQCSX_04395 [Pseudarthrobacter sp. P1]|uniref:hypothetical protein n=1 Tax=Pseudarthrobacter sp. P1 TaxID=3418418 RepID=UPI003CF53E2A
MRHFTIAARTNDKRVVIAVHVYETREQMLTAAQAFNGDVLSPTTEGVTQAFHDYWQPQAVIRYCYPHLHTHVLLHELVHAAQVAYRWTSPTIGKPATEHFTHYNEDFAHLVSDLHTALHVQLARRFTIT